MFLILFHKGKRSLFLEIRKSLLSRSEANRRNRDVPYIAPKKLLLLFHIKF